MKTMLIAEDDRKMGAARGIQLEAAGHEVQVLRDDFGSHVRAMTDQPDLILMDSYRPLGSGSAVAQELKRAKLADIPIIFMTASMEKNLRERAEESNAVGFFEKPFDTETLLAAISRAPQSKHSTNAGITK